MSERRAAPANRLDLLGRIRRIEVCLRHGMTTLEKDSVAGTVRRRRPWIGSAIALGATLGIFACGEAHAYDEEEEEYEGGGYINPGLLFSPVFGRSPAVGVGGELSFMHRPEGAPAWCRCGVGMFGQVQHYFSVGGGHTRWAAGLQAGGPVGFELGLAHRGGNQFYAATSGIHVAPYFSLGVVSVALRFTIPIQEELPLRGHGFETALAVGFKVPIPYGKTTGYD